jgi:hypothetical protein
MSFETACPHTRKTAMHQELVACNDAVAASVVRGGRGDETMGVHGYYTIECVGPDGVVKWTETAENVVPNQGKNAILDNALAGSSYTAAYYMSLITAGTAISTSTYAVPTVTETTSSIIAARVAMTWSAASGGAKSASTTAFSIIGSATITGNMVVSGGSGVATVANTSATGGVLLSAANFTGGSKTVANLDTLNVTYSMTLS